jgi:hypothetical protein
MIIGSPITLTSDSRIGAEGNFANMTVSGFNKIGTMSSALTINAIANGNVTLYMNGTPVKT